MNADEREAIMKELGIDNACWSPSTSNGCATSWRATSASRTATTSRPGTSSVPLIPVTLELAALSILVAVCLGVPAGVISAVRQDTGLDYALRVFSLAGLSMPAFWLGMVIILGAGVLAAVDSAGDLRATA